MGFDPDGTSAIDYRLAGLPATLFVDASGRLVDSVLGPIAREHTIEVVVMPGATDAKVDAT